MDGLRVCADLAPKTTPKAEKLWGITIALDTNTWMRKVHFCTDSPNYLKGFLTNM